MASSSNKNVFLQVQGVLNEDWINSSNRKLTEVLEEIEEIEGVEIRFQRGTHVVLGTIDQLLEVQNLLLGKARASSSKETAFKNSMRNLETDSHDEFKSDKMHVKTAYPHEKFVKTPYPHEKFVKTAYPDEKFAKTAYPHETLVKTAYPHETFVKTAYPDEKFAKTAYPHETFAKTANPHETHSPTELMVDRDIWEYIESKKQGDVRQLEDVFGAIITKVADESGVLRLILKTKSHKTCDDNLQLMLESLGVLYAETVLGCVTETAQFQLADEERELAMEHISAQFSEVLVKKCIYTNDVLFIGPLHDARDARHQFQLVARRLIKGELRTPGDKRGQFSYPKYPHEHPQGAANPNAYEDAGFYQDHYWNRYNGQQHDFSSASKYGKGEGMVDANDGRIKYQQHDVYNETSWKKKQGSDDVSKSNLSKKPLQYPAEKEYVQEESDNVQKSDMASHGKHLHDEDPGPKRNGSNAKTEDIVSSLKSLNLGEENQGKDMTFPASKTNTDDQLTHISTELNDTRQQHGVATDTTALTKATKKNKKVKAQSYDLPKVTIVKQNFEAAVDETQKPVSRDKQTHNVEKKPYDSPSSSDSEAHQTGHKKIQNAERQNGQAGLGNRREGRSDKSTEELASQETIRNILEDVENTENQVNAKELVKRDTGSHSAADNLKIIQPSGLNKKEVLPQPANGTIACIIDKGFHLNGCPKSGTIEISMTFEAGIQGADQPEPGRLYQGMKLKAFLPASGDGREVLRLTKSAFAARKLFQIKRNEFEGEYDIIVPNGVLFKEATDQFPDPDYLPNVIEQLKRLTE